MYIQVTCDPANILLLQSTKKNHRKDKKIHKKLCNRIFQSLPRPTPPVFGINKVLRQGAEKE
jgi:hypothetical protein